MSSYLNVCEADFDILSGTVSTLFESMLLGAKGGVVSLADAIPRPCCELYNMLKTGEPEGAKQLHYRLFNLNRSGSGSFGVAGVKYAMDVAGYNGGNPRLPLLPLSREGQQSIKEAISKAGFLSV